MKSPLKIWPKLSFIWLICRDVACQATVHKVWYQRPSLVILGQIWLLSRTKCEPYQTDIHHRATVLYFWFFPPPTKDQIWHSGSRRPCCHYILLLGYSCSHTVLCTQCNKLQFNIYNLTTFPLVQVFVEASLDLTQEQSWDQLRCLYRGPSRVWTLCLSVAAEKLH